MTFADTSSLWLRSMDGGATWERAERSAHLTGGGYSYGNQVRCVEDDLCYVTRSRPVKGEAPVYLIDRMNSDHTWRNEATFHDECVVRSLTVDPQNVDRALVECGETAVAVRTGDGVWRVRDVIGLAKSLR